jgi:parvulin-like peptidyl-prolyl isomerase
MLCLRRVRRVRLAHFLMRALLLLPVFLVAALAAGCGGGGGGASPLKPGDVAVVGSTHIGTAEFKALMSEAKTNLKSQGQAFPKAGTAQYATIKSRAVTLLVQEAERETEAAKLGLAIPQKDIQTKLDAIKKQYFSSSDVKYRAALKAQNLTDAEVRHNIQSQLISQKLFTKLTKDVSVTPSAVTAYCAKNSSACQPSRAVRYILVGKNKSALAQTLFQQLHGASDATWCTLVKKYSQDSGSKATCGKTTFTKGLTVPEFDKLLFSLGTNTVGKTNSKQYGWFVLEPTAATKKAALGTIATQLLTDKKNAFMTAWVDTTTKTYCKGGKVKYQAGYAPSPDPCVATKTTTT